MKGTFMSKQSRNPRPPASNAGKVAAALLLVVALFQAALALGAPWGEAALGGANTGVLPDPQRASSVVSVLVYLVLAGIAGTNWTGPNLRRRVLYGTTALMVLGAVMNIASPSFIERIIWAPVTVVLVIALWNAARHESLSPAAKPKPAAARAAH